MSRGENLWTIAKRYGVSLEDLAHKNGVQRGQNIYPGDRLEIPGGRAEEKPPAAPAPAVRVYTVKKGDTIWRIAKLSRTSVREIQQANNLGSSGLIRPGDVLRIPVSSLK